MKNIIYAAAFALLSNIGPAAAIRVDFDTDEVKILDKKGNAGTVDFFENGKLLGRYSNLIVREGSISSGLVKIAGGGIAIEIDSNGSKSKYNIITPIINERGRLYTECSYKSIFDAIDERRAVGAACQRTDLAKFDTSSVINESGMTYYDDQATWIRSISSSTCPKAVGIEVGAYRIARCSTNGTSESKRQKIIIFNSNGKKLNSIDGFEFIPINEQGHFSLTSTINDSYILFRGNLECLSLGGVSSDEWLGSAKIGGRLSIKYAIHEHTGCYAGKYSYTGGTGSISLSGYKYGNSSYLLETNENGISSGLFILNHLDKNAHGVWIKAPPKTMYSVN